jgi:hypothetical protein
MFQFDKKRFPPTKILNDTMATYKYNVLEKEAENS